MVSPKAIGKSLILVFEDGLTQSGNPKLVQKTLRNVSTTVTDDLLYQTGEKMALLYNLTLYEIRVDEDFVLERA